MRILFVCHRFPFPPNRGGKIRPFHMIQHLGQKHDVVVASLAHSEQELREGRSLKDHCADVLAEVLPTPVRWMQACRALASSTPSSVAYFSSAQLHRRVREAWRREAFDAVFVHCAFVAQYVIGLQAEFRILDFGDLDSGKWLDYARYRALPLSMGYKLEGMKLRRYEVDLARQFDCCTVTTRGELDEFRALSVPVDCTVIPNGVDGEYFYPRLREPTDSSVIVFLGRMDYFPNVDGVTYFERQIFPLVRQSVPQAELRIVGSNPTRAVRNLARIPGVSVTGHVPDVRPYLVDAAVAVAPLRIARGTQNKILQFMAMGIPVVATPEAAKGVQAVADRHLLVAEGHQAFAERVVELLRNAKLRKEISEGARRQIETAHKWSLSMQILDSILDQSRAAAPRSLAPRLAAESG